MRLLREGYLFLPALRWEKGSDVVALRLLGKPALAVYGVEGARMFYERPDIRRKEAVPGRVQKTLMGEGGVQGLDGNAHRHRKAMFMDLMTSERLATLSGLVREELHRQAEEWLRRRTVHLLEASERVIMAAAAAWTGVPLARPALRRRTRDMAAMVDSFATVGPRHWLGRWARNRAERWMTGVVERTRTGDLIPPPGAALAEISLHRDLDGELLPARVAAVEVLNVIRPMVAVGRFVAFTALALHQYDRAPADDEGVRHYVQEVRRFYPFTPFVAGRVADEFEWRGVRFPVGAMVLVDAYGLNHDPRVWKDPHRFDPERFRSRDISPYEYLPQGGGDFRLHHRCAGEDVTMVLLTEFTRFLTRDVTADLPPQDLTIDLGRIPTRPASGVVLANLRRREGVTP